MALPLTFFLLVILPGLTGPPPWLGRCLAKVRPSALQDGAPLPIDSPQGADHGTCAARCEGQCLLLGDFDGDGKAKELALAGPSEVVLYHEVERGKARRVRASLLGRLPVSGEEVALLSAERASRFAEEVGLLRDGRSPLPALQKNERLAFGLLLWQGPREEDDGEEEHGRGGSAGELLLGIFDGGAGSYRLQRVLQLGTP